MAEKALSTFTYEAYLSLEAESDTRYEFHDGYIVALAGGSPVHSQICANMIWALNNALGKENKGCIVHASDLKVHVEASRRTYYPDVTVVCEDPVYFEKDPYALTNPTLIVEVLSENTAAFDRGAKFSHYRQIASLREYVLISQDEAVVDTYFRTEDGLWEIKTLSGLQESIFLKSIGCPISLSDIYLKVSGIK